MIKKITLLFALALPAIAAFAQHRVKAHERQKVTDTLELQDVIVTGLKVTEPKYTALHIEPYSLKALDAKAPYNLSDALAKLPGISQLSTGNAISKPVIRGLYGNRILVLLSGLRFDNQQFQDEHGLGLSQVGIDRVEVIRGPASILYGTDAIGGVINVVEETPPVTQEGNVTDATVRLYGNTLGTLTDIGTSHRRENHWWRIRGGYESHGDYSDGNGTRVYDSRNTGYYLKAGIGFEHPHWVMNNAYHFSYNQFGFILDSLNATTKQDGRWSRSMANPHHNVLLNALSSQNTFYLGRTADEAMVTQGAVLKINAGAQSNKRAEDEGGGEISLNMHLASGLQSARLEKMLSEKLGLIISQQFTFENNTNYGKRIIVPDANMMEGNIAGFLHWAAGSKLILEAGGGYTTKYIRTFRTGKLNTTGKDSITQFSVTHPAGNAIAGFSYNPAAWLNVKGNVATGVRTGNLAELSSDGVHEGTYRYEIGNKNLKAEQNINADVTLEAAKGGWSFMASGYYNHFNNYIYLQGTNDYAPGHFQIFRFVQQDAKLYGGEAEAAYTFAKQVRLQETFSLTQGKTADGAWLPFIPANRSRTSLRVKPKATSTFYLEPEVEYAFKQDHPGPFETATADYTLLNCYAGIDIKMAHHPYSIRLSGHNLLNRAYADHLSRLKYFGINNQGLDVVLSVSTTL